VNTKRVVIAATIVVVGFLLLFVPPSALVFVGVPALWGGLWIGMRSALRWWKQRQFLVKAQSVSEIRQVSYFRRVPEEQLENWIFTTLTARRFVLLGDPVLGRPLTQGYAWHDGKRAVVVIQHERPLIEADLRRIYTLKNKFQAVTAIVVSPFPSAPRSNHPGLQILAGKDLLRFMSVLDGVPPMKIGDLPAQFCSCGSQQVEHVSRAGEPLLVCSRYPDCSKVERPSLVRVHWCRDCAERLEQQRLIDGPAGGSRVPELASAAHAH